MKQRACSMLRFSCLGVDGVFHRASALSTIGGFTPFHVYVLSLLLHCDPLWTKDVHLCTKLLVADFFAAPLYKWAERITKASKKAMTFVLLKCLCCFAMSQVQQEIIWKKAHVCFTVMFQLL